MALKKTKIDNRVSALMAEISQINGEITDLNIRKVELEKELLNELIKPFKIGGYALVQVPCGKTTKEQKCLLECGEWGTLYARPVKADGELSGRHFSIIPVAGHNYLEYLKEVK